MSIYYVANKKSLSHNKKAQLNYISKRSVMNSIPNMPNCIAGFRLRMKSCNQA